MDNCWQMLQTLASSVPKQPSSLRVPHSTIPYHTISMFFVNHNRWLLFDFIQLYTVYGMVNSPNSNLRISPYIQLLDRSVIQDMTSAQKVSSQGARGSQLLVMHFDQFWKKFLIFINKFLPVHNIPLSDGTTWLRLAAQDKVSSSCLYSCDTNWTIFLAATRILLPQGALQVCCWLEACYGLSPLQSKLPWERVPWLCTYLHSQQGQQQQEYICPDPVHVQVYCWQPMFGSCSHASNGCSNCLIACCWSGLAIHLAACMACGIFGIPFHSFNHLQCFAHSRLC
jgi:hypothetical protein